MGLIERTRSLRRKPSHSPLPYEIRDFEFGVQDTTLESRVVGFTATGRSVGYDVRVSPNPFKPSVSSGSKAANRAVDRSRELDVPGRTIEFATEDQVFRFPTPSPRLSPNQNSVLKQDGSTTIGIALGSPRTQPVQTSTTIPLSDSAAPSYQSSRSAQNATPVYMSEESQNPSRPQMKKSKSSTWKALFVRKPARPSMPETTQSYQPPVPAKDLERPRARHQPIDVRARQNSASRGLQRHNMRAEMDRTFLEQSIDSPTPTSETPRAPVMQKEPRNASKTTLSSSQSSDEWFDAVGRHDSASDEWPSPANFKSQPLLNVAIPQHSMERYSVMFEGLLKPKPSLLERRNGTLKRLKPLGEDVTNNYLVAEHDKTTLQRRATSPSLPSRHSPLPVDEPQPSPNAGTVAIPLDLLPRPGMLQRSQTAPVGSISPATARLRSMALMAGPSSLESSSPIWSEASLPPTPKSSDGQTVITFGEEHSIATNERVQILPQINEAAWEVTHTKTIPLLVDSLQSPQQLTPETPIPAEAQAVKVSVARQVSFSRARRPMQKPIAVKQGLRPKVVDMPNRKSTMVMIEHA